MRTLKNMNIQIISKKNLTDYLCVHICIYVMTLHLLQVMASDAHGHIRLRFHADA